MLLQRQSSQERAKLEFIPTYQYLSVTRTVQNDILASNHNIHHEGQRWSIKASESFYKVRTIGVEISTSGTFSIHYENIYTSFLEHL